MLVPRAGLVPRALQLLLRPLLRQLAKHAAPKYGGEVLLAGLKKPVRVRWQRHGIPHVFAENESDLFFSQGYLHAQERLWQMDLARRFLSGRIAEVFGRFPVPPQELTSQFRDSDSVDVDYFMRLVGIRKAALAAVRALGEEDRQRLDCYSTGVNRFIESCGTRPPLEFRLLRYQPEPWGPEDTLIITKGFAFVLSLSLFTRLNALAIAARLAGEPEKFADLYPAGLESDITTARAFRDVAGGICRFSACLNSFASPAGAGSNAWVIGPTRSKSGHPLLCNDPHLRLTLPSTWYLMHLSAAVRPGAGDGYAVWGGTLPGCPGVQLGHNRHIAWGLTAALCDDVELYRERIHRLDPDLYEVDGCWQRMEREQELIAVRGQAGVTRALRRTRHGPVISDFKESRAGAEVISLCWTAHQPGADFHALYELNCARNWQEFLGALSLHGAPTLNFFYTDRAGNIGFALAGSVPKRTTAPSLLPVPGWRRAYDWHSSVPFEKLPRVLNPSEGAIANANNRIVDGGYPFYLSRFFEPPYRAQRIHQLITARRIHGRGDVVAAQTDKRSLHALEMIRLLREDLAAVSDGPTSGSMAARRLLAWDGECGADSIAACIFQVFYQYLIRKLLVPHLGEDLFLAYVEIFNQSTLPISGILRQSSSRWFVGISRAELVRIALEESCAELGEILGPDQRHWQWGRLHTLTLNHPFSRVSILRPLFSTGPFPAGGDNFTVDLGFFRRSNPYHQIVGASLRMIVEAGQTLRSWFTLPSGQSGHAFSPHYLDLRKSWRKNEYVELSASDDELHACPSLVLQPAQAAEKIIQPQNPGDA